MSGNNEEKKNCTISKQYNGFRKKIDTHNRHAENQYYYAYM